MIPDFSLHHFRFHLELKGALQMPAFNKASTVSLAERLTPKGNGIRGLALIVWEVYLRREGGVNDENL